MGNSKSLQIDNVCRPGTLTSPIGYYCIGATHNSFLNGPIQICTCSSPTHIRTSLESGFRCLELDVHLIRGKLTVLHGNDTCKVTTPLPVEQQFEQIVEFIQEHPLCSPIFLIIQNEVDTSEGEKMLADTMVQIFGDLLVQRRINPWIETPESFRGKILFIHNYKGWDSPLFPLMSIYYDNHPYASEARPVPYYQEGIFARAYPRTLVTSKNSDFSNEIKSGTQIISIHDQTSDKWGRAYLEFMEGCNEGYKHIGHDILLQKVGLSPEVERWDDSKENCRLSANSKYRRS